MIPHFHPMIARSDLARLQRYI
uniref:Uncharacterized protein n=1 Tax=Anguilla anguilla TaxID=7936 RepID=A0A0E9T2P4_ANGAN